MRPTSRVRETPLEFPSRVSFVASFAWRVEGDSRLRFAKVATDVFVPDVVGTFDGLWVKHARSLQNRVSTALFLWLGVTSRYTHVRRDGCGDRYGRDEGPGSLPPHQVVTLGHTACFVLNDLVSAFASLDVAFFDLDLEGVLHLVRFE